LQERKTAKMKIVEFLKPSSGAAQAKKRAKELEMTIAKLMEMDDEQTFLEGLEHEFRIGPDHPRYETMLKIWRDAE
jgi:hypothetical protein